MAENKNNMEALEKARTRKRVPETEYLTQMEDSANVLELEELRTCFFTDRGVVRSVDGVSFSVPAGKTVAVVGESGCGKSVTSLSVMQLLQRPQGQITGGAIRLNLGDKAYDLAKTPETVMRHLRGGEVSMIFQEPMTSLNPVLTIGKQIGEAVALHDPKGKDRRYCHSRVLALLEQVGIANGAQVCKKYPHELSGGMRQRIVIAMALAGSPRLIIADEPTTALDVTVQAQILELLKELKEKTGCAILLITHDLGVVAGMADLVVVMYAGRVVEQGTAEEIFYAPAHPYTRALMAAKPVLGKKTERLHTMGGSVPDPGALPQWCYFRDRCGELGDQCAGDYPDQVWLSQTHRVSCWQHLQEDAHEDK